MKNASRIKALVLALTCLLSLIACTEKPPAKPQTSADEVVKTAKIPVNIFPKSDYLTRNIQDEIFYVVTAESFDIGNKNDAKDDLAKIQETLEYIEGIGATAIWMTPILVNKTVQTEGDIEQQEWGSEFTVDPSFGNQNILKSLIEVAHSRNIKVFFKLTSEQTSSTSDLGQASNISGLTDVYKKLVTEFTPDGFSINNVNLINIGFWQSFVPAITEHAQALGLDEFFIFGEALDGTPIELSQFTTHGSLPSMLDVSFSTNAQEVVFGNRGVSQLYDLFSNDDYYRDSDSSPNDLINFLGKPNTGDVNSLISTRLPGISEQEKVARNKVAHALMYFSRGVPVLFYDNEQGIGDMVSNSLNTTNTSSKDDLDRDHPFYTYFSDLAKVRHAHKSLRQGEHLNRILDEEKSIYAFSRIVPDDMIDHLLVFNFSTQQQQTSIGVGFLEYEKLAGHTDSKIELSGDQLMIDLPPLSYIVLNSNIPMPKSRVLDINLQASYEEDERAFLSFDLSFSRPEQFNFAQIKIYALDKDGQKSLIAFDTTPPYRAILLAKQFESISQIEVIADNFQGQTKTKVFDLSMQ